MQPENAAFPIVVIESGKTRFVNTEQLLNALSSIDVTESGIIIVFKLFIS